MIIAIGGFMFGFRRRQFKILGETKPKKCGQCSHERPLKYVEETRWFSILFVPLFPYKKRHVVVCQVCGAGIEDKEGLSYTPIGQPEAKADKESVIRLIKEKFDRGEITRNEYIRMINVIKHEASHTH